MKSDTTDEMFWTISFISFKVLEACSKCYECLCCEEYAIAGKCDVARKTLIDSLVVKFKEAMQDFFAEVI
jgi:hypothetical protein